MKNIFNIIVSIILGLLSITAVYGLLVVANSEDHEWIDVSKVIPSVSLSIGVFIGWLTYTSNIFHKHEDKENSFSFEYLNECVFWFGKIYKIIEPKNNLPAEDRVFGSRLYFPKIIPEIESLLSNISVLSEGITNKKHESIYEMRKVDLKNQLYNIFNDMGFNSWSSFTWGEKKTIIGMIEDYNVYQRENREKIDARSCKFQENNETPFAGGVDLGVIHNIFDFFGENIKTTTDSRLDSFKEYESVCKRYVFVDGCLIEKS